MSVVKVYIQADKDGTEGSLFLSQAHLIVFGMLFLDFWRYAEVSPLYDSCYHLPYSPFGTPLYRLHGKRYKLVWGYDLSTNINVYLLQKIVSFYEY